MRGFNCPLMVTALEDRLTPATAVPDAEFFSGEVRTETLYYSNTPGEFRIRTTGPGGGRLQMINAATNEVVVDVQPFGKDFVGGLVVTRFDYYDQVTAPGLIVDRLANFGFAIAAESRGSARVKLYEFDQGELKTRADFIGVGGAEFRGGASITIRHLNGTRLPDLVVGAGAGGGPRVAVYELSEVIDNPNPKPFTDFFVFSDLSQRGGISFDVRNYSRDGSSLQTVQRDSVLIAAARSGVPRVSLWQGRELGQASGLIDEFVLEGGLLQGVEVDATPPLGSTPLEVDATLTLTLHQPGGETEMRTYEIDDRFYSERSVDRIDTRGGFF